MFQNYVLPSSPQYTCEDRFSILDTDEDEVLFWDIFKKLILPEIKDPSTLVDIMDTIGIIVHGQSRTDFGLLKEFLALRPSFFETWPFLARIALDMPKLFPDHCLPCLSRTHKSKILRRDQTACLVLHQFLCTLRPPSWQSGYQDFHFWYTSISEQPHHSAGKVYLTCLLEYLDSLGELLKPSISHDWVITFELHIGQPTNNADIPLTPIEIVCIDSPITTPDSLGLPDGACVISANRYVGFGQSATQEEVQVGTTPECCPIVLFTPPLEDDQVLVVRGAEQIFTVSGMRRDISIAGVQNDRGYRSQHRLMWAQRTMLFMDALEFDSSSTEELADLAPENLVREKLKSYTAFSSGNYKTVVTRLWGCGAFGGNPGVKTIIQWCAATLSNTSLRLICAGNEQEFGRKFESFARLLLERGITAVDLEGALMKLDRRKTKPDQILTSIQSTIFV